MGVQASAARQHLYHASLSTLFVRIASLTHCQATPEALLPTLSAQLVQ